jgi:hypothetical protein
MTAKAVRGANVTSTCTLLLVPCLLTSLSACNRKESQVELRSFNERTLRSIASQGVLPAYPNASHACGVAVAEIQLDGKGRVTRVSLLEAPDSPIGESTINAISSWKFGSLDESAPPEVRFVSTLTFYFVNRTEKSGPAVFDPESAPNVSNCTDELLQARY